MTGTSGPVSETQPVPIPAPDDGRELETDSEFDSAYAGSIAGTETTSLHSAITKYREENGRTYHSFGSTEHWGPNDQDAQDQQDLTHHLWSLALNGALYTAPVKNPQRILDLGTGTGIWAIDVADLHPEAVVDGIDLSPIQPTWLPPNVKFMVDDYNADWLDVEKYDLIHARELLGTVPNWVDFYKKALVALKPGGWFEQSEPSLFFFSDHTKFDENHPYTQWGELMLNVGRMSGLRFDIGPHLKGWMEEAGFTNIHEVRQPWPVGGWPKDQHQRAIGQWNHVRLDQGIKDFCARRFTNNMGWKPEAVEVFCAELRNAFKQKKLYGYQWAYYVYGQAPDIQASTTES